MPLLRAAVMRLVTSLGAVWPHWSVCSNGYWPRFGCVRRQDTVLAMTRKPASAARGALPMSATSTPYGKSDLGCGGTA